MIHINKPYGKELRSLSSLAIPITLSQLALLGIGVTDVIVSSRAGVTDLAGVTLGNNAWTLVIYFFFGISVANQPLISRAFGENDFIGLRRQFQQSLWMALLTGVIGTVVALLVSFLLYFIDVEPAVRRIATSYIQVIALAALAMTLLPVLRTTLESIGKSKVVLLINSFAFLMNIPLDIALVHGSFGLPKLGGVGCAWASVIVLWASALISYMYLGMNAKVKKYRFLKKVVPPNFSMILNTVKLGLPIGASILIELGLFNGAAIAIATIGEVELAAHAVAISAASVTFMLYLGIAQASTILASRRLGAKNFSSAVFGIYFSIKLSATLSLVLSVVFVIFRYELAGLYSSKPEVIELAAQLLIWSAIFQAVDAIQVNSVCGLRAFKDTLSPLRYQIIAFWFIAFPLGYWLSSQTLWPSISGAVGFWIAMTAGLVLAAVLITAKLVKEIRVNSIKVQAGMKTVFPLELL